MKEHLSNNIVNTDERVYPKMLRQCILLQSFMHLFLAGTALTVEPCNKILTSEHVRQKEHPMKFPSTYTLPLDQGHIVVRQAQIEDVPSMQKCNLATLPENYFPTFYTHFMRLWPDLAIVAEHVIPSTETSSRNPLEAYNPSSPKTEIVGYVLGNVEIKAMPSKVSIDDNIVPVTRKTVHIGHIASLAVRKEFRRKGIARIMMREEHHRLRHYHSVILSDLHVRASNIAAQRLYTEKLGYKKSSVCPDYYQEYKEDGILMIKNLETLSSESSQRPLPIELSLS